MKNLLSKQDFIQAISNLHEVKSVENKTYTNLRIDGKKIKGYRVEAGKEFSLSVEKLYQAYCVLERPIKTTQLKKYISPQSPAKAILDAIE